MNVSIIMPVYNAEKFLNHSIESILLQSYKDFEFIIVNDGSTDLSLDIIKKYKEKDHRIKLINNKSNMGISYSLNIAINSSSSKYIARMDSDDISLPNRIERQFNFFKSNPSTDILGTLAYVSNEDKIHEKTKIIKKPTNVENIVNYSKYACPVLHPTYFVKKKVYDDLKGYRELYALEDYDFIIRSINKGFVIRNLNEPLIIFRRHSQSISAKNYFQQISKHNQVIKLNSIINKKEQGKIVEKINNIKNVPMLFSISISYRSIFIDKFYAKKNYIYLFFIFITSFLHFRAFQSLWRITNSRRFL